MCVCVGSKQIMNNLIKNKYEEKMEWIQLQQQHRQSELMHLIAQKKNPDTGPVSWWLILWNRTTNDELNNEEKTEQNSPLNIVHCNVLWDHIAMGCDALGGKHTNSIFDIVEDSYLLSTRNGKSTESATIAFTSSRTRQQQRKIIGTPNLSCW